MNHFFLKAFLFLICLMGGYFITRHLWGTQETPWLPYLGALLGLSFLELSLEIENK
jgi:hypothetical protein